MKICPSCEFKFKQRKKGRCPHCGVEVYYASDGVRRESDKQVVKELLGILNNVIDKRDGIRTDLSKSPRDMKFATKMLDWAREFQNRQSIKFSAAEFVKEVVNKILADQYWGRVANDFFTVYNQRESFGRDVYKDMLQQHTREQADKRKMEKANVVDISY